MTVWTPEDIRILREMADAGLSPARIAARLKRRMSAVKSFARTQGIALKTKSQVRMSFGLHAAASRSVRPDQR